MKTPPKEMQQMNYNKANKLNEHLSENDLKWLVDDGVLIDMHKTKLGKDRDYIVLSIAVNDQTPAVDLARFIENSVHHYEDVEVSPATDSKGRYLVYVEMKRNSDTYKVIEGILKDSSKLTGIDNWKFRTMNIAEYVPFEESMFNQYVIVDPILYEQKHPEENEESVTESIKSRLKFLLNY